MTSPLPQHGRLSRSSLGPSTRNSPMLKSPSTPYDMYRIQHPVRQTSGRSSVTGISATRSSSSASSSVFLDPASPNTYASYRRNAGFGSPGASASRSPRVSQFGTLSPSIQQGAGRPVVGAVKSSRFVRRKPWQQRIREAPSIWLDRLLFSEYLDFGNPALGYPLGALLHFFSLMVLAMHPNGALRLSTGKGRFSNRGASLFADQSSLTMRRQQQQNAAWRWSANLLMLSVVVAAVANAYHLFTARRRYHLWLKSTDEVLKSENARLVSLPSDVGAAHQKPWHDVAADAALGAVHKLAQAVVWLTKKALARLRVVRYLGVIVRFFFPPSSRRSSQRRASGNTGPQMHALDVWQAPEVPLRIFTVYSPLHLFVYWANLRSPDTSSSSRLFALTVSLSLMAAISAQTFALVYFYSGLVKDKSLIAGEVLNEYNQKFVMPRAMPVCRDASTMTMQAEMLGPDDFRSMAGQYGGEVETKIDDRSIHSPSRKAGGTPRRSKVSRGTAT